MVIARAAARVLHAARSRARTQRASPFPARERVDASRDVGEFPPSPDASLLQREHTEASEGG